VIARIHLRLAIGVLLLACAIAGGLYWFRSPALIASQDLVQLLPANNATIIYVDVDALRHSGFLQRLAGSKVTEDPEYRQFVHDTKFDYREDLSAVAAAFKGGSEYFAVRGRFHWSDLKNYALGQNGSCHDNYCIMTGSRPNRRISFYPLKSDVLAMAVSSDDFAAYQIVHHAPQPAINHGSDPIWASVPAATLQNTNVLPDAAQGFIPALKSADQIVFSIGPDRNRQLDLALRVTCKDAASASTLLNELQTITKGLRDGFSRRRQTPNPAEVAGVLVAGTFWRDDRQVYGAWPLPPAFIDSIAGTGY
jgi:hypothetical protein